LSPSTLTLNFLITFLERKNFLFQLFHPSLNHWSKISNLISFKISLDLEDALPNDGENLFGSTDPFFLPKEEALQEKCFSTDASEKPGLDCHSLKLEPSINVDGGMFFFFFFFIFVLRWNNKFLNPLRDVVENLK